MATEQDIIPAVLNPGLIPLVADIGYRGWYGFFNADGHVNDPVTGRVQTLKHTGRFGDVLLKTPKAASAALFKIVNLGDADDGLPVYAFDSTDAAGFTKSGYNGNVAALNGATRITIGAVSRGFPGGVINPVIAATTHSPVRYLASLVTTGTGVQVGGQRSGAASETMTSIIVGSGLWSAASCELDTVLNTRTVKRLEVGSSNQSALEGSGPYSGWSEDIAGLRIGARAQAADTNINPFTGQVRIMGIGFNLSSDQRADFDARLLAEWTLVQQAIT